MREAGVSSTVEVAGAVRAVVPAGCARPTGGGHGCTADGPTQHTSGKGYVKILLIKACEGPRLRGWSRRCGQGQYRGRSPKAPARGCLMYATPPRTLSNVHKKNPGRGSMGKNQNRPGLL